VNTSANIAIVTALIFYSVGVWSERLQGRLKWWHLACFVLGLTFDACGTGLMFRMAGGLSRDLHGISGAIAIALMFVHALWAFLVLLVGRERALTSFHKFSLAVWVVWLIPFFSPMVSAMLG
jgi:uncharacterized repeat protein (TIGR03987 family)